MAAITPSSNPRSRRRSIPHLHLDMTPMVDLGFLLITFFMLTTHLIDHRVMDLKLPLPGSPTEANNTLTILLDGKGRRYGYQGEFNEATTVLQPLGGKALRNTLQRFKELSNEVLQPPVCIVKAGNGVRYQQVVTAVDELNHAGIERFSVQDSLFAGERQLLAAGRP